MLNGKLFQMNGSNHSFKWNNCFKYCHITLSINIYQDVSSVPLSVVMLAVPLFTQY